MTEERRVIDRVSNREVDLTLQMLNGPAGHYELLYNGAVFRSTYDRVLSHAFANTILGLIKSSRAVDILLGGFGFGDSLKTVLGHPGLRSVTVVESDEILPRWGKDYLDAGDSLDDERTRLVIGNFSQYIEATPRSYHGIGLELDLGPNEVLWEENRRAYSMSSLKMLASRLRSDGILVIRTTEEDKAYRRALDEMFSEVGVREIEETNLLGNPVKGVFYVARM
jgi:spermidine synthase